jgi:uncharacterized phage protein gp47/JayE
MANLLNGPIDYTTRDYESLRSDLIAAVQQNIPAWNGSNPNDFLRVLLEAVAFQGDIMSYYTDRVANEMMLDTATQRQSIINIARVFGYIPSGPLPAYVSLTFSNTNGSTVSVPAGTQVKGTYTVDSIPTTVAFETLVAVTVPGGSVGTPGTVTVDALQGVSQVAVYTAQSNGDPYGVLVSNLAGSHQSDGSASQEFFLPTTPVLDRTVRVWLHSSSATSGDGTIYTYTADLLGAGPTDAVFTTQRYADGRVSLIFGDGVNGAIPPTNYYVRSAYRQGGGEVGNVPAATLTLTGIKPDGSSLPGTTSVTNATAAIGGAEEESNDSIRANAYRSLRARNRAVTLSDFEDISLRQPGIGKANAIGSALTNVIVYLAPLSTDVTDPTPGLTSTGAVTTVFASYMDSTQQALQAAAPAGTSVMVTYPLYTPILIDVTCHLKPNVPQSVAKKAATSALLDYFDARNSDFGQTLYESEAVGAVVYLPEIGTVTVNKFRRVAGYSTDHDVIYGYPHEILTLAATNLTVSVDGGVADATSITLSPLGPG